MDASATVPVLAPSGDLDLATSRDLATQLGELAGMPGNAVLDLSDIAFMDSVGLGVVLKGINRFSRQGKQLVVVAPPDGNPSRLFELSGTRERVCAVETRNDALTRANAGR